MRNRKNFILLIILAIFAQISHSVPNMGVESVHCEGGDGGVPLSNLSMALPPGVGVVQTEGLVKDFIYWEKRNTTVYRNENDELYAFNFNAMNTWKMADHAAPLSRVIDNNERYVTLDKSPAFLDSWAFPAPKWIQYPGSVPVEHLYWQQDGGVASDDKLYSLESVFVTPDYQQLKVVSYAGGVAQTQSCKLPTKPGEVFHVAKGHVWPYVFLYKTRREFMGTRVTSYRIRIKTGAGGNDDCSLYQEQDYSHMIPGNVTDIYVFPPTHSQYEGHKMFVVTTDHPTHNLLWDDGKEDCRFYNFHGRKPMIINNKQPVIATWVEKEGLSLIYPRKKVNGQPAILNPMPGLVDKPILKRHLWLTDDGKQLIVAAKPLVQETDSVSSAAVENDPRMLFTVDLRKVENY